MAQRSDHVDDTDENHIHGIKLVIFTITLMLGQFLTSLDTTVLGEQQPHPFLYQSYTLSLARLYELSQALISP